LSEGGLDPGSDIEEFPDIDQDIDIEAPPDIDQDIDMEAAPDIGPEPEPDIIPEPEPDIIPLGIIPDGILLVFPFLIASLMNSIMQFSISFETIY
jgi:hypothetical protein